MRLRLLHTSLIVSLCALFTACSDTDLSSGASTSDDGKTPIELSVGEANSLSSRADFVDGKGLITAFENDTRVHLLMICRKYGASDTKYSETYGTAEGSGTSVGNLDPDPDKWTDKQKRSKISFESGKGIMRYWDDAFARESLLDIYGFAYVWKSDASGAPWYPKLDRTTTTPDDGTETQSFPVTWKDTPTDAVGTKVGATDGMWIVGDNSAGTGNNYKFQSRKSILEKDDICYSNNIKGTSALKFDAANKKFTSDNLEFHRAMSMLTIKVYKGEGFTDSEFKFATGTNIALKGFNKKGYLNIKEGKWDPVVVGDDAGYGTATSGYSWSKIDLTSETLETDATGSYYTLLAMVIPGTNIKNSTVSDAFTFTINNNEYKVPMAKLYEAICSKKNSDDTFAYGDGSTVDGKYLENGTDLKQGINYEFTLKVGKSKIDNLTAQIVDWETVKADNVDPSNARITLTLENRGTLVTPPSTVAFWHTVRSASTITDGYVNFDWYKDYSKSTNTNYSSDHWTTEWFWQNNQEYHHLRALVPSTPTVDTSVDPNTFDITSSNATDENNYNEIAWGAPFNKKSDTDKKFYYNTKKGFDAISKDDESSDNDQTKHQIYRAIGPTKERINLTLFHMMSGVKFTVKTSDNDNEKVELCHTTPAVGETPASYSHATLELVGYKSTGTVNIGNGLVSATGTASTETTPVPVACQTTDTGANIDQMYFLSAIPQDLTGIKVVITTPDNNKYEALLKDILATVTDVNMANPYTLDNGTKYKIDSWYPNYKYEYTFTLKKKGIDNITATVVNWDTVHADNQDVTIQ